MGTTVGWRVGVSGFLALAVALIAPGVATVQAQPEHLGKASASSSAASLPAAETLLDERDDFDELDRRGPEPSKLAKRRLRRLRPDELSTELTRVSADIIRTHHKDPFGTELTLAVAGKRYVARIEQHYHPEGGAAKPWGYHAGVSLLTATD